MNSLKNLIKNSWNYYYIKVLNSASVTNKVKVFEQKMFCLRPGWGGDRIKTQTQCVAQSWGESGVSIPFLTTWLIDPGPLSNIKPSLAKASDGIHHCSTVGQKHWTLIIPKSRLTLYQSFVGRAKDVGVSMYHFQLNYFSANKIALNWTLGRTFGGGCGVVRARVIGPCAIFSGFLPEFLSIFSFKRRRRAEKILFWRRPNIE